VRVTDLDVVAALERAIAQRIGEPRYNLWFSRNTKFLWEPGRLTVGVPNLHFQEWLQKTFGAAVQSAAAEVFGGPMQVVFRIDPELFQAARREQERVAVAPAPAPEKPAEPAKPEPKPESPRRKRRWRRLSDFVVGACNRVAHAAAVAVAEAPGEGGNPLVLYGPVGTGKTHLLEGIYLGLRRGRADMRPLYVTAEEFMNRFLTAMRLNKLPGLRRQFRECDALLVDDVHFLAGKQATLVEFLHTVDALLADGAQVVLACDCHPRLADDLPADLIDRLLGGVIWGLLPPDPQTRLDILRAKACAPGEPSMAEEVLRHLGSHLRGNVRELEGAVHTLRHFSRVTGRPINLALAREALADLLRHAVRVVQVADVDRAVCNALRMDAGVLQSKQRAWAVSHPRMLAMYLSRKHTAASHAEIGRHFGGRNHSTVVAAEKRVRQWLQSDGELTLGDRRLRVRELIELAERELFR
jgi:chromosomal replication initiator protein